MTTAELIRRLAPPPVPVDFKLLRGWDPPRLPTGYVNLINQSLDIVIGEKTYYNAGAVNFNGNFQLSSVDILHTPLSIPLKGEVDDRSKQRIAQAIEKLFRDVEEVAVKTAENALAGSGSVYIYEYPDRTLAVSTLYDSPEFKKTAVVEAVVDTFHKKSQEILQKSKVLKEFVTEVHEAIKKELPPALPYVLHFMLPSSKMSFVVRGGLPAGTPLAVASVPAADVLRREEREHQLQEVLVQRKRRR